MDTDSRMNLEQLLRSDAGQRPIEFFLKHSPHLEVVLFDRDWIYVDSNRAFRMAYRPLQGSHRDDFFEFPSNDGPYPAATAREAILAIRDRVTDKSYQAYCARVDQYHLLILIQGSTNPDKIGEIMNFMTMELANTMRELRRKNAELLQAQQQIEKLLDIDPMTGLYNRRFMDRHLPGHISLAERQKMDLCVAICDLDHFKEINDEYGHQIGDRVLINFSSILRLNTRVEDACIRFGGEEFIVVMPALEPEHALSACERYRRLAENPGTSLQQRDEGLTDLPPCTVSIGVAQCRPGMDDQELIRAADEALYQAKARGRNQVVLNTH